MIGQAPAPPPKPASIEDQRRQLRVISELAPRESSTLFYLGVGAALLVVGAGIYFVVRQS